MSKENPTPENNVYNKDGKTISEFAGVDVRALNKRMEEIFTEGCNPREAVQKFHENFTHKELAVMFEQAIRPTNIIDAASISAMFDKEK